MTDVTRVRMWAMGLAMEMSADDTPRDAIEERAQWMVDWVMGTGAAHEPEGEPHSMKAHHPFAADARPCDVEF